MGYNSKRGVPAFCQWARDKYGMDGARKYIRMDLEEDEAKLRARLVAEHFAVWAEFMAHYVAERISR